ncbi:MAG: hypothetical protein QNI87_08765 [Erythrobacter sp.]|uniref:hypothetical protein n=1 Tax=Erythrobacter sp. TaxID=1042 RepID=UPI00262127C4|nr:hypothetical protein [Erythrobacter sp.]MDJ0978615.1 hypothetical protein [Erythrobacter sp.]
MRTILVPLLAATALAVPVSASAHDPEIIVDGKRGLEISPNNESNPWWIDYQTDLSEAKRELRSDLRRATDYEDRVEAKAEYQREVADAKHDYRKEMAERGYRVVSFRENRREFYRR